MTKRVDLEYTINEWFEVWIKTYKYKLNPNTIMGYRTKFSYFSYYFGDMKLDEISHREVQNLFNDLIELGYANRTIKGIRILIRQLFKRAVINGMISKNPIPELGTLANETKEVEVLTIKEQKLLLSYLKENDQEYYELISIMLNTGLRNSEIRALRDTDIDLKNRQISISKALHSYYLEF